MVGKNDIVNSLRALGLERGDIAIFHSSLKSFGRVDGGAECVIAAVKETLSEGTVVFPSLVSRDFAHAYENWNKYTSPSDVGLIFETFRCSEGVLRSDQATHSVTACGRDAEYITEGHCDGKPRAGIFGETPFSHSSPWQKMYELDGKVVLLGVTMVYNTYKHFVEYCFAEAVLESCSDPDTALAELSSWEDIVRHYTVGEKPIPDGVWFWNDGFREQEEMQRLGLLRQTQCGEATLTAFKIRDFYGFLFNEFKIRPEKWLNDDAVAWVRRYCKL